MMAEGWLCGGEGGFIFRRTLIEKVEWRAVGRASEGVGQDGIGRSWPVGGPLVSSIIKR